MRKTTSGPTGFVRQTIAMKPSFSTSLFKLLAVGAFFYATYGFANWFAAQRNGIPEIAFAWESAIPFWPWTIVPYWTLNFFYALAFFLCSDVRQQNRYIAQLLAAQVLAVSCFLLFPLQFSWPKPDTDGLFGGLFASLAAFDQPYNQAPSLHIILVLVVGRFYWYRLPEKWRAVWFAWFALIALSVLTTWQHHFIDIPTGLLAGALVLWTLPWHGNEAARSPLCSRINPGKRHGVWVLVYVLLSAGCAALACLGGFWLWWLWPAVSCMLVATAYAYLGAAVWQKQHNGRFSLAAGLLLWPHRICMEANRRFWLYRQSTSSEVLPEKIHIGSIAEADKFGAVLDVCAELPVKRTPTVYASVPMLDMVAPSTADLRLAAGILQKFLQQHRGPVLVCCALGYGRSVAVVLAWLLLYGGIEDWEEAVAIIRNVRPGMVLPPATRRAVLSAVKTEGRYG